METAELSTEVRVPPEDAYAFLRDVPGYERYSEYLASVRQHGDGGPGTEYEFTFQWWKLTQAVRCRITQTDSPREIHWEVIGDIDAHGKWLVEETADGDGARVVLVVTYDADSGRNALDLPALASFDWVVERVLGLLEREGETIVERAVADLEGQQRSVEVAVKTR